MHRPIYIRFIFTLICLAFLGFISVSVFVKPSAKNDIIESSRSTLYDQAYMVSNYFRDNGYKTLTDYALAATNLSTLNSITNSTIWIMDIDGTVVYNSSDGSTYYEVIPSFDPDYFDSTNSGIGNFYDTQDSNTLSVIAPIINSFTTTGYVVIHMSDSTINTQVNQFVDKCYIIYVIMLLITATMFSIFIVRLYIPLNKLKKASIEYAKGNLAYGNINVKTHDELGSIAGNLEYMATQLNDLEEYQNKFISNISHDFRSPLTSIKGYVEAMLDGTIPVESQEKYLNIVLNESERLTKLTKNLLTINSWDNAGRKLITEDFDIITVVKNTLPTFEGICNKKKISFDVTYGAKSYIVNADMSKIQQVIYNLLDNALKFSSNNSVIAISVMEKNDKVFVSIKDNGIGIPKESLNKIWDRFYKTDLSRGKDKTGSGLGLAIVKDIIQTHNENIDVISTEGVGTEFVFTLKRVRKN